MRFLRMVLHWVRVLFRLHIDVSRNKKIIWKFSCMSDHFIKSDSEFFIPVAFVIRLG